MECKLGANATCVCGKQSAQLPYSWLGIKGSHCISVNEICKKLGGLESVFFHREGEG